MAERKRTIISVERNYLTVVRPPEASIDLWCDECSATVPMVTPEHAASLCGQAPRAIYRRVENGELHFTEVDAGGLLLCVNSLRAGRMDGLGDDEACADLFTEVSKSGQGKIERK
jgi:hypothetical protein